MNRILTVALAAGCVLAFACTAQADNSQPSQSTLSAMGLSGMQVMSDAEATAVRGYGYYAPKHSKSYVKAYGTSYAHVSGKGAKAGTKDGFYAEGNYYAKGKHGSKAKIVITHGKKRGGGGGPMPYNGGGGKKGGGGKQHVKSVKVYAGGWAYASSK